jgi:GAF domain-containing protein
MTTAQASNARDTPELITQFNAALVEVRKSVRTSAPVTASAAEPQPGNLSPQQLRRHIELYLDLMSQRSLVLGDPLETAKRVDETAASALECARVSVWLLDREETKITCFDLFERNGSKHSSGVELFARDFKPYFRALATQRTIAAHDAQVDPRTECFTSSYLKPLGITSMLDVPIWVDARMVGVVCHEHQGPPRQWNLDEERFAYLMASFVSLSMERITPSRF